MRILQPPCLLVSIPALARARFCAFAYAGALLAAQAFAIAQGASSAIRTDGSVTGGTDEAIELTPFVVSSERDTGYAATETLAGTRMRTNLRDVASSMSVLTPEFLRDLSANSIDEAAVFLPSSDRPIIDVNMGGSNNITGWNYRFGASQQISIRGITVQGASSDFFSTSAPGDFYNTERVTISRGPNSILFGVGGPGGTAMVSTKRPTLGQRRTTVMLQTDRWGTFRNALDHNQPLVPGRLAVRVNALHEDRREFRNNEGQWQDRLTVSATARPFKNTTITGHFESWRFDRNYAPLNWWFTNGLLRWVAAGRPTVDFVPGGRAWTAGGRTFVDASGKPVPVAPGVSDPDGWVDAKADFDPNNNLTQNQAQNTVYVSGLQLQNRLWNLRYQPVIADDVFDGISGWNASSNLFDPIDLLPMIPRDANLNFGSRAFPSYESSGRWGQVFLEQKIAERLYLEVAANAASNRVSQTPHQLNLIKLDVAKYLPDGSLNPGYLQPYAETSSQIYFVGNDNKDLRATLSYEWDATRWNRWLGRHHLSGLWQYGTKDSTNDIQRIVNKASPGFTGWSADPVAQQHHVMIRQYYLQGQVPGTLASPKELIANLSTLQQQGRLAGATAAEQAPLNLDVRSITSGTRGRQDSDSASLAWQGLWMKERLVTTFGVRKDSVDTRNLSTERGYYDPAVAMPATLPPNQTVANYSYYTDPDLAPLPSESLRRSGTTRTYAGVWHAARWLSFTYNRSENFVPEASSNPDYTGGSLRNSRGETRDWGFKLFLLNDRLVVSANEFKNRSIDRNTGASVVQGGANQIMNRLRTNYRDRGDSHFAAMLADNYPVEDISLRTYMSTETTGRELSIVFNPTRNWRAMVSGSQNRIRASNLYSDAEAFLYGTTKYSDYAGIETWRRFAGELQKVAAGQKSNQFDLDPSNPAHVQQASADAAFILQNVASQDRRFKDAKATEGAVLVQNGEYAANGMLTYAITSGSLKGWEFGLNGRWRSAPVAGYVRLPNADTGTPEGVIDVNRPIKGDAFYEFGAMIAQQRRILQKVNLRLQLNIENLLNQREPLLRGVGMDSLGVYGPAYATVPLRWEMRRPRNVRFTATFEF